ncbi:hypothetical protein LINPERPRIM_LOCUS227, partial [Linum perenne]
SDESSSPLPRLRPASVPPPPPTDDEVPTSHLLFRLHLLTSWSKYQKGRDQKSKSLISISSSHLDTQASTSRSLQFHRTKDLMRPPKRSIHMLTTWVRLGQGVSHPRSRDSGSGPPLLHRQRPRQALRHRGGRPLDRNHGSHLQAHDGEGLCHLAHEDRKQAPK